MQRANIVLADGAATPVNQTFNPAGETAGIHAFENRVSGQPIGFDRLTISIRPPTDRARGVYKVQIKLARPTLEQTSPSTATGLQPVPTVAYTTAWDMTFMCPSRGTVQQRKDARVLAINFLQSSMAVSSIDSLEDIW